MVEDLTSEVTWKSNSMLACLLSFSHYWTGNALVVNVKYINYFHILKHTHARTHTQLNLLLHN